MEQDIILAITIMLVFSLFRYLEQKYLEGVESIALKYFVRDAFVVGVASFIGIVGFHYMYPFILLFMNNVTDTKIMDVSPPPVFTGDPGF